MPKKMQSNKHTKRLLILIPPLNRDVFIVAEAEADEDDEADEEDVVALELLITMPEFAPRISWTCLPHFGQTIHSLSIFSPQKLQNFFRPQKNHNADIEPPYLTYHYHTRGI